jgi:hypothetical protein
MPILKVDNRAFISAPAGTGLCQANGELVYFR